MKKRRVTPPRRKTLDDGSGLTSVFSKDGTMRGMSAIVGVLIGVIGSYVDMGRKLDVLSLEVRALAARVESVEKCLDRHANAKK